MFRSAFRTASAFRQAARQYSVATQNAGAQSNEFLAARQATKEHAGGSADLWRKISYYLAIPSVAVAYFNSQNLLREHAEHVEHEKQENGGELPERIVYPYMNKRDKEFPWGMNTLFHNPHTNINSEEAEE